jgi:hypothetical protein
MNKFGKSLRSGGSIDYLSFTDDAALWLSKWLLESDEELEKATGKKIRLSVRMTIHRELDAPQR